MFSNPVRLILIFTSMLAAILMFYINDFFVGLLFVISAALFTYGYFRYSTVYRAFRYLQEEKNEKAAEFIDSVKYPNLLTRQQSGFYNFTKAVLEHDEGDLKSAETFYLKALEQGVKTTNNEAIINLNLAKLYLQKDLKDSARKSLQKARELSDKEEIVNEINELIPQIEV